MAIKSFVAETSSALSHAGSPPAANDFVCKLTCQSGPGAAGDANASSLPPAGVFNPPYAIGNGASNLPLGTKVNKALQPMLRSRLNCRPACIHSSLINQRRC